MQNSPDPQLIKEGPYWRVVYRPDEYSKEHISTLSECRSIVEKNRVSLRGWDYPHVAAAANPDLHGTINGKNWCGGWSEFMSHLEYWRFYQSTQFIHLATVRESREPQWREKLQGHAQSHHSHYEDMDWDSVPGFFGFLNFIYTVTEIAEFAARLTQAGVYEGQVNCSVEINNVEGYVLTPSLDRAWWDLCRATQPSLSNTWIFPADKLVGGSGEAALEMCIWFFERLGWENPSHDVVTRDISNFLSGKA